MKNKKTIVCVTVLQFFVGLAYLSSVVGKRTLNKHFISEIRMKLKMYYWKIFCIERCMFEIAKYFKVGRLAFSLNIDTNCMFLLAFFKKKSFKSLHLEFDFLKYDSFTTTIVHKELLWWIFIVKTFSLVFFNFPLPVLYLEHL